MLKIVIFIVYFNFVYICNILMYLNIFIYLYILILMLDVMLSKWIMKMIEKNFCVIFDKIWNIYIFCEY